MHRHQRRYNPTLVLPAVLVSSLTQGIQPHHSKLHSGQERDWGWLGMAKGQVRNFILTKGLLSSTRRLPHQVSIHPILLKNVPVHPIHKTIYSVAAEMPTEKLLR